MPTWLISNIFELMEKCEIQARVTHNTDAAVTAAQAACLMTHVFIYDKTAFWDVPYYLEQIVPGKRFGHCWSDPWDGKVGPPGCESVHAAYKLLLQADQCRTYLRSASTSLAT